MKTKKLLLVVLCMILSICAVFGGCKMFEDLAGTPDNSTDITVEQPEEGSDENEETDSDVELDDIESDNKNDDYQTVTHVHNLTYYNKVKATCTTDGTLAYWGCSDCGKYFADKNGKNEILSIEIKATGHTLTHHAMAEATCTEDGTVEYWSCSVCNTDFSDSDGTTRLTDVVIKATGHTYSESWTADENYHWHAATCEHTDEVKDKQLHSYNAEHVCVCGKIDDSVTYGLFSANDFLITDGADVRTREGETVYLRGINAGGLFVTEHWMTGFETGKISSDDYKTLTLTFIERFGVELTQQLWAEYRANWWTDSDFKNCVDMGMTVIRLPFTYMNVDFAAILDYEEAGKNYDFTALDEFVSKAAEYGLYVILDLHGAYGSQNGQDHSGEIIEDKANVDFYSNEKMQELTLKLWSALAKHYKSNPAVAGYDILNEPGEKGGSTSQSHWNFYDKIYKAIRAENDNHIIIFESCWEWYNLPVPSQYGWTNCMYSFHHYVGDSLTLEGHVNNWTNKLSGISAQNFGLPLQMGEFTAYDSTEKWAQTLELLNSNNWHYTSWTYKVWGTMPWGVINVSGNKVDPINDSYSEIIEKFSQLRAEYSKKYTFKDSGRTLESIFRQYLLGTEYKIPEVTATEVKFENGSLVFTGNVKNVTTLYVYLINTTVNDSLTNYVEAIIADDGTFEATLSLEIILGYVKSGIPFNIRYKVDDLLIDTTNLTDENLDITQVYGYEGHLFSFTVNSGCVAVKYSDATTSVTATYVGFEDDCIVVRAIAVGANDIKFIVQNTASSSLFLYEAGEITLGDGGYFELRISLAEFNSAKSNANLNLRAYINGNTSTTNIVKGDNCDISQTYIYNGRTYLFAMNGSCVSFKY